MLVARRADRLRETAAQLEGTGHSVEPFDLLAVADIPAWLQRLAIETGALNGLVHAAGTVTTKPLRFMEPEDWSQQLASNLGTAFALAKGFRHRSVCAPPAALVFLASVAASVGIPGKSAYSASKGGLISMTRSLAVELARDGIRVNAVAPGWVETEMTAADQQTMPPEQFAALQRRHLLGLGRPADVASAIAFLLADTGRWVTGTTLVVDGGFSAQ